MPQANDVIFAGDIKVEWSGLLSELLSTVSE